jgi:hypothetical protein
MDKRMLRLASVLANLYPDVASTQRLMVKVGMRTDRILAEQTPETRWFYIVMECEKAMLIPDLLAAARGDYPEHISLNAW